MYRATVADANRVLGSGSWIRASCNMITRVSDSVGVKHLEAISRASFNASGKPRSPTINAQEDRDASCHGDQSPSQLRTPGAPSGEPAWLAAGSHSIARTEAFESRSMGSRSTDAQLDRFASRAQ